MSSEQLENKISERRLFLIVEVAGQNFGLEALKVKEIIAVPTITKVPRTKSVIRGLIKLREQIIPLLDTRQRLSFRSVESEDNDLVELLKARKQDHINWVDTLLNSVMEQKEFTLQNDPSKCNFGKWYYSFKTDNVVLADLLDKFELPHSKIHRYAERVKKAIQNEGYDTALELCNQARDKELKQLVRLFDNLITNIKATRKEFAVVYELEHETVALSVDKVHFIAEVQQDQIKSLGEYNKNSEFARGICYVNETSFIILDDSVTQVNSTVPTLEDAIA